VKRDVAFGVGVLVALALLTCGPSCSQSTRNTAINAAANTTLAAGSALVVFDGPHEMSIVAAASTKAAADAGLAAWRAERSKIQLAIVAATQAEIAALTANDNASLATMASAVSALVAELKADGVSLP
jgi:hypothetical protein